MTKCTVFNPEQQKEKEDKKPIEFVTYIHSEGVAKVYNNLPHDYDNIVLIKRGTLDTMLAYDTDPDLGLIYLGHWNDGVVE